LISISLCDIESHLMSISLCDIESHLMSILAYLT